MAEKLLLFRPLKFRELALRRGKIRRPPHDLAREQNRRRSIAFGKIFPRDLEHLRRATAIAGEIEPRGRQHRGEVVGLARLAQLREQGGGLGFARQHLLFFHQCFLFGGWLPLRECPLRRSGVMP